MLLFGFPLKAVHGPIRTKKFKNVEDESYEFVMSISCKICIRFFKNLFWY